MCAFIHKKIERQTNRMTVDRKSGAFGAGPIGKIRGVLMEK